MLGTNSGQATGNTAMLRVPARYIARSAALAPGMRPSGPRFRTLGESRFSFFSGDPCHSWTITAPRWP